MGLEGKVVEKTQEKGMEWKSGDVLVFCYYTKWLRLHNLF